MSELRTVRGMRDLMGPEMRVHDILVTTAVTVFQHFGYEPLDSPALELWDTLAAKGGTEIEAETFKFKDKGDRDVGLRFDLTVPLARIVASNPHLPRPFKRYAIGKAWRYDRPQAGRYREFVQADVDIVGTNSPAADAEVVMVALEFFRRVLGEDYVIKINNRKVLRGLVETAGIHDSMSFDCFRAVDKLDKIGKEGVLAELATHGIDEVKSSHLLKAISVRGRGVSTLDKFQDLLSASEVAQEGLRELYIMAEIFDACGVSQYIEYDLSLARGLDYYTGPVFEGRCLRGPDVGSIAGGGRYDSLIERFGTQSTPATGISLGIGRMIDLMMTRGKAQELTPLLDVYVAPIGQDMMKYAMHVQNILIRADINCEVDLMGRSLKKILEQADSKRAALTVIVGARDIERHEVSVRDMRTKDTKQVRLENIADFVRQSLKIM